MLAQDVIRQFDTRVHARRRASMVSASLASGWTAAREMTAKSRAAPASTSSSSGRNDKLWDEVSALRAAAASRGGGGGGGASNGN
jgi:hypothetical protein